VWSVNFATSLGFTGTEQALQLLQHIKLNNMGAGSNSLNNMYDGIKDLAQLVSKRAANPLEMENQKLAAQREVCILVEAMRLDIHLKPLTHIIGNFVYSVKTVGDRHVSTELHTGAEKLTGGSEQENVKFDATLQPDGTIAIFFGPEELNKQTGASMMREKVHWKSWKAQWEQETTSTPMPQSCRRWWVLLLLGKCRE